MQEQTEARLNELEAQLARQKEICTKLLEAYSATLDMLERIMDKVGIKE